MSAPNVSELRPNGDARGDAKTAQINVIGNEHAIMKALRTDPDFANLLRYNEFARRVEIQVPPPWRVSGPGDPWLDSDDVQLKAMLQAKGMRVTSTTAIADSVAVVARDAAYHPVRRYLSGLQWDGRERLVTWLVDFLCADGDAQYLAAIGIAFPVSAVARVMKPGCQADHVLVLEGAQGIGKSSAIRTLAVRPDWYCGTLPDLHSKDALLQLHGRWLVEISELRAVRAAQIETTKSFLTQTHDVLRVPFGRRAEQFTRQNIFCGTTNEREYLRDRSGNRRFWPVACRRIDLDRLEADRDQLWAEAVHRFNAGQQWHLTPEQEGLASIEQGERVEQTEIEAEVGAYLADLGAREEVSVKDVLVEALHLKPCEANYAEQARKLGKPVSDAMKLHGWNRVRRARGEGDRRSIYRRRDTP